MFCKSIYCHNSKFRVGVGDAETFVVVFLLRNALVLRYLRSKFASFTSPNFDRPMRTHPYLPLRRRENLGGRLESREISVVAKRSLRKLRSRAWFPIVASVIAFTCGLLSRRITPLTFESSNASNTTSSLISAVEVTKKVESRAFSQSSHEVFPGVAGNEKAPTSTKLAPSDQSPKKNAISADATLPFESETPKLALYDFSSVPVDALNFARKWISSNPACKSNPNYIQAACCRAHCGGISDRTRGILIMTVVAAKAGRQLCLVEDYFMSGPWPKCEGGAYLYISNQSSAKYLAPWLKTGKADEVIKVVPEDLGNLRESPGKSVRYMASSYATKVKEIGVTGGRIDAKKFGMVAIAVSGVLRDQMNAARNMLHERVGKTLGKSYVSLNMRCGESVFKTDAGNDVLGSNNHGFHDGFRSQMPDRVLDLIRKIPRGVSCKKKLFLSADSALFRKEVKIAMPVGVKVVSCCSAPVHIGYGPDDAHPVTREEGLQHLVDLIALSESSYIFKGDGGFTELGTLTKSWNPVRFRSWPGLFERQHEISDEQTQMSFMNHLLETLECDQLIK